MRRGILTAAGAAVIALTALVSACSSPPSPSPSPTGGGEVFLAPATDAGADPFTPNAAEDLGVPRAGSTPSPSGTGIPTVVGTTPRTYAGKPRVSSCDRSKIVAALTADPAKAAAWASVLGIPAETIPRYVEGLAALVLPSDTRVTNHGYRSTGFFAFQAVLQAGTAVLVDATGLPRVRCACGNPLTPPVATSTGPSYVGTKWPGFDPALLTVIIAGPRVTRLTVINIVDNTTFVVPVSSPGAGTSSPATSPSATPTPGGSPAGSYTSCSRRYAELVVELTASGSITPAQAQRWAGMAEDAANAAGAGNLDEALRICEQTVSEMEAAR